MWLPWNRLQILPSRLNPAIITFLVLFFLLSLGACRSTRLEVEFDRAMELKANRRFLASAATLDRILDPVHIDKNPLLAERAALERAHLYAWYVQDIKKALLSYQYANYLISNESLRAAWLLDFMKYRNFLNENDEGLSQLYLTFLNDFPDHAEASATELALARLESFELSSEARPDRLERLMRANSTREATLARLRAAHLAISRGEQKDTADAREDFKKALRYFRLSASEERLMIQEEDEELRYEALEGQARALELLDQPQRSLEIYVYLKKLYPHLTMIDEKIQRLKIRAENQPHSIRSAWSERQAMVEQNKGKAHAPK